jgi:hypothetical protein
MPKKTRQIVGAILVAIFALYYANISLFYHSHIINGVTVIHSHFHGKAHEQTGTHSQSELTLISSLSSFQSPSVALFFVWAGVFLVQIGVIGLKPVESIYCQTILSPSLRAPPAI